MLYVKNLHKSYQTGKVKYQVLNGIDFHVERGEFVAVMGPSGSGKTTLLNCISCYIPFDKGAITMAVRTWPGRASPNWLNSEIPKSDLSSRTSCS